MKLQTVMVLYSILMFGCSAPYEENSHSHQKSGQKALTVEAIAQAKTSCLITLHKVTSRDDLIKQMFETALEDDCLYHFSPTELEKIWDIPVFDYVQVDPMMLPIPPNKDIESPIGLYVEKNTVPAGATFRIEMTLSELEKHFSIFPEGYFPSILPEPKSFTLPEAAIRSHHVTYIPPYQSPPQAKIKADRMYYWFKDNQAVATSGFVGEITYLSFLNYRSRTELSDERLAKADHSE
ncbi:MAG TPA: hypothetical protein PK856_00240 [Vitreoscilla sp.]|nr:hypothetical protein [Vitreoscilla sp.]